MGWLLVVLLAAGSATGCQLQPSPPVPQPTLPTPGDRPTDIATVQPTPSPTTAPSATAAIATVPTLTPIPFEFTIWLAPALPYGLTAALRFPEVVQFSADPATADFRLEQVLPDQLPGEVLVEIPWVYALVMPFQTALDGVTLAELQSFWRGENFGLFDGSPLIMEPATLAALQALWGQPAARSVRVAPQHLIYDEVTKNHPSWAVVAFESLDPRWKVIAVDGISPIQDTFDPQAYPLTVGFGLSGPRELAAEFEAATGQVLTQLVPATNRDPSRLTTLVMTGVTALVRGTAYRMELHGVYYPAQDIGDWLRNADFTHLSNEVEFFDDCPPPEEGQPVYFCSPTRYLDLFEHVGADIIELTGNHYIDTPLNFGSDHFFTMLQLFQQNGYSYFGGGEDLAEASRPLLLEHHGNRLAFLGCNLPGPEGQWATESFAGTAPCGDFSWLREEITRLRQEGYLVIVTVQHAEDYTNTPTYQQRQDFQSLAEAGAIIINGSQAHTPKGFGFSQDAFIHYGMGNLFFDQMAVLLPDGSATDATRAEFIDRHVFYNGRHLSVELMTAMLEDYAKPRPMTLAERRQLLRQIFNLSDDLWQ